MKPIIKVLPSELIDGNGNRRVVEIVTATGDLKRRHLINLIKGKAVVHVPMSFVTELLDEIGRQNRAIRCLQMEKRALELENAALIATAMDTEDG